MKKLLLFLFLLLTLPCIAQIEYETDALSISLYDDMEKTYEEWGEWQLTKVYVVLNIKEATFNIYSNTYQEYELLTMELSIQNGYKTISFEAIDQFQQLCIINLMYLDDKEVYHLYIKWKRLRIVYQMRKL